jgi:estrogen-related receptor beta like 1
MATTAKEEPSPSQVFYQMESALDKLKCLNYEQEFLGRHRHKAFGREHFALPGPNPSIQFQEFIDLVVWLIGQIKRDADAFRIDKYDDPITSVNKLMLALRSLDFEGDFPATKLKMAHGECVCAVLDYLTDKALAASHFTFRVPKRSEQPETDDAVGAGPGAGGGAEGDGADDIEDEIDAVEDDIQTGMFSDLHNEDAMAGGDSLAQSHAIIESRVDPIEWKTELERVGPRLRTNMNNVGKEWRSHIEQTKKHEETIKREIPTTEGSLQQVSNSLGGAVEKIKTKEKYANTQFSHLAAEYQKVKEQLKEVEERYQGSSSNVSNLTNDLATVSDQLNEIKGAMDSTGSSMTDTSPLVKIKSALQEIKLEISHFELRIGVVGHTLLQAQTSAGSDTGAVVPDVVEGDDI